MKIQKLFKSLVCVTLIGDTKEKAFFVIQEVFSKNTTLLDRVENAPIYICEVDLDHIIKKRFSNVVISGKHMP